MDGREKAAPILAWSNLDSTLQSADPSINFTVCFINSMSASLGSYYNSMVAGRVTKGKKSLFFT